LDFGFKITLQFSLSIGIGFDQTMKMIVDFLTLIVSDMKKLININSILCVAVCGALLGSNYIPIARKRL